MRAGQQVHVEPLAADLTTLETSFDPALTYYADGTPVVMRAADVTKHGTTAGRVPGRPYDFQRVQWVSGGSSDVAPHVLHRAGEP